MLKCDKENVKISLSRVARVSGRRGEFSERFPLVFLHSIYFSGYVCVVEFTSLRPPNKRKLIFNGSFGVTRIEENKNGEISQHEETRQPTTFI